LDNQKYPLLIQLEQPQNPVSSNPF